MATDWAGPEGEAQLAQDEEGPVPAGPSSWRPSLQEALGLLAIVVLAIVFWQSIQPGPITYPTCASVPASTARYHLTPIYCTDKEGGLRTWPDAEPYVFEGR